MIRLLGMSSPNVQKVHLMLEEVGLPFAVERIDVWKGENFMPAFAALNPNRKVPILIDEDGRLTGAVPLARLFVAPESAPLRDLVSDTLIQAPVDENRDRVTELFDKYNLLALPVVDEDGKLAGVITADEIISVLRNK